MWTLVIFLYGCMAVVAGLLSLYRLQERRDD